MSNDSTKKTIIVALGVCLVCSVLVASATVALRGRQLQNKKLDKIKNILQAGNLLDEQKKNDTDYIMDLYNKQVRPAIIDLKSGDIIPESEYTDKLNPEKFDIKAMSDSPEYGERIAGDLDIASIKKMPRVMAIYMVLNNEQIEQFILPVYGYGLWSTMYGFLALNRDLTTIGGITFYEHGETPGLGGEIDNPLWKALWQGKKAFDENNTVKITVIKGKVDTLEPGAEYQVDGLSGATLTTRGVDYLVKFWLGENGYGAFLAKQREVLKNE
ncbi:MAG TPA: Na(+)-translocating NADH-quinone reductase subunit C [bacterium]|nr:Na(+)-translocating NADH-quinone reductase subunit C [bacterium]HPN42901.1 Na(+)-translocating NADH-quinone reductase subunit C [bacterium]